MTVSEQRADRLNYLVLFAVFACIIAMGRMYRLYPIDDDWSYIRAAQTFFESGRLQYTPWTSPSLVFQVLWGSLFASVFGFSVNTLVLSVQVLSLVGMLYFYRFARSAGCSARVGLWCSLLLIFNPYSFPLLFTFFTDHLFLPLAIAATYHYFKAAQKDSTLHAFLGSLFTTAAVLERQPGLLIAAAAALQMLWTRRPRRAAIALALPVAGFLAFTWWFTTVHGPTYTSKMQVKWIIECLTNPVYIFSKLFNRPLIILEFFGFSCIPLALALLPAPRAFLHRRQQTTLLGLFCLASALFYVVEEHLGIYSSLYSWMNGFHFAYVSEYGFRGAQHMFLFLYKLLDVLAVFSLVLIVYQVMRRRRRFAPALTGPLLVPLLVVLLQLGFFMVVRYKFTRYYLLLLPFVLIILSRVLAGVQLRRLYFWPLLAGFALLGVAGAQDFMAFNQARWQLGQRALDGGVPPLKLSGGFPWDGWHHMDYQLAHPEDVKTQAHDIPWWFQELLPAIDPEYLLAVSPVPSGFYVYKYFYNDRYSVREVQKYFSLLYLNKMKVLLLRRAPRAPLADAAHARTVYRFVDNFAGAEIGAEEKDTGRESMIAVKEAMVADTAMQALVQPSATGVAFRLQLPDRPCRLRMHLATAPETWDKGGDGLIFKVQLSANLLENLFDTVGMTGVQQRTAFLMPRSYFLGMRTIYMQHLDPKIDLAERVWHTVHVDLTRFSGKVVDLAFVVDPGMADDDDNDVALWGDPVIEEY